MVFVRMQTEKRLFAAMGVADRQIAWTHRELLSTCISGVVLSTFLASPHFSQYYAYARYALVAVAFAGVAWLLRGVTSAGSLAGGMLAFIFLSVAGFKFFSILLAVFVITLAATKIRARKLATTTTPRGAAQVLANLLVPSLIFVVQSWDFVLVIAPHLVVAALAELTADTVSSEIGEAYGRHTLLVTTFKPVGPGTNGGISLIGTATGIVAAISIIALMATMFPMSLFHWRTSIAPLWPSAVGAVAGMFLDSLLGATLERKGWIGNEVVNVSGTASAVLITYLLLRFF